MIAAALALLHMMAKLAAAAGLAAAALGLSLVTLVYAAEPDASLLAQGQGQQKDSKAEAKSAMTRCIETWDPATQMSKKEWKESCERTTKENPNLYDKPY
jgi:hypothetical protein